MAVRVALALLAPLFAPARRAPVEGWSAPRRILVLKPCCTGDLVFATPLLAALKTAYPGSRLTVATSAWCAPVVAHNPHVDAVLDVPATIGPRQLPELARRLRAEGFDLAVVPDRSALLGLLAWLARVPRRAGLDSDGRGFLYTDRVPVRPDDYTRHEAALYAAVGAAVGAPTAATASGQRTEYHPSLVDLAAARATVAARGWQSPLWCIHPGGGVNPGGTFTPKRWPPERFAALADSLLRDRGGTVLLLGGATDADATAAVRAAMHGPAEDLAGEFDFAQSLGLAHHAALYVGNDTGMTHAAHAGGTPTVAIFGPTSAARYGLWGAGGTMAVGRVPWSPCWRDGALRCTCGTVWCMEAVSTEAVRAAADRTLVATDATYRGVARGPS